MEERRITRIPINTIDRDETQPRKDFPEEELKAMALNIETVGLNDPIHVSPHPTEAGRYILFDGECRLRAHKISKKLMSVGTIEAIIKENNAPENLSEYEQGRRHAMQTAKNSVRIQMSFLERADSYRVSKDKGVTIKELADIHGVPEKTIIRDISIAGMPEDVRQAVNVGKCPITVAVRILESFPNDITRQAIAWEKASHVNTVDMPKVIAAFKSDVDQKPMFEEAAAVKNDDAREYSRRIANARKDWDAMKAVFARLKEWATEDGVGFFVEAAKKDTSAEETLRMIKKASEVLSEGLTLKKAQTGKLKKESRKKKAA